MHIHNVQLHKIEAAPCWNDMLKAGFPYSENSLSQFDQ